MSNRILQSLIVVSWAAFLGGFTFLAWTEFALLRAGWCIQTDDHCLREWVGALSGYFGGGLALLAAWLTIPYLSRQVGEAKRQADFAVGDTNPTAVLFDAPDVGSFDLETNWLEVINWNRHPVIIRQIKLDEPHLSSLTATVDHPNRGTKEKLNQDFERRRIVLPGWLNRAEPPPIAQFFIFVAMNNAVPATGVMKERREIIVEVHFSIAGEETQNKVIYAGRPDGWVSVSTDKPDALDVEIRRVVSGGEPHG